MKKILLLASLLFCTVANAQMFQTNQTVMCGETKYVMSNLVMEDIKEQPVWVGEDNDNNTRTVIMLNPNTLTWSVVQFTLKVACVLSIGEGYTFKKE